MVVRPSPRAPKLDINGLKDTISSLRRLCDVGRKCENMMINETERTMAKMRNSGVTDAITTMDDIHIIDNIAAI